ncbi:MULTISPECIES: GNAT family N-acetyltransferase [unclassified Cellulophaga]|uniref:GNAT family N-acetyltransferase n=1 Tax=unclassified Cellulophaga TaxID=2634405 RepID=UPI001C4E5D1D|nr:GNAT family N-acetyltransferase [Cellulophaga sp. HaHa_2_1]QXP52655.1 GNAT family N-acetyltransferase [Cellulophaga sp. HaHa_2_1]
MIEIKEITAEETYPLRHEVMYPNHPFEYIKLPKDQEGKHFAVVHEGKNVTVVSLFFEDSIAQFRKLATLESEQGKGHASRLLNFIIAYAKEKKAEKLWCNARANKTRYYKKFGLKETQKTYTEAGIDFIILEMDLI